MSGHNDSPPTQSPKVSVIMPIYNGVKYMKEAIDSVRSQTYSDWELILVNDGSQDSSQKIIDSYLKKDTRIRSINQSNKGQSVARNVGVSISHGQYITFLDQDDRYYPERLSTIVQFLENNSIYGMVYSNVDTIDKEGRILSLGVLTSNKAIVHPKKSLIECLGSDLFIVPGSTLIKRDIFDVLGGFDPVLSGYEDDDLFLRVFMYTRIGFIETSLLQWRIYPESSSYTERMDKSRLLYAKKLLEMFPDDPRQNLYWRRDVIVPRFCTTYMNSAYIARLNHDNQRVKRLLQDVQVLHPKLIRFKFVFFLLHLYIPFFFFKLLRKIHLALHRSG